MTDPASVEADSSGAGRDTPGSAGRRAQRRRGRLWQLARFLLALAVLFGVVLLVVRAFRPQLVRIGTAFVERFGLAGVALGTYIADGFHFPLPPQFYMLLAIAAGRTPLAIIAATSLGSVLGGMSGFLLARRIGRLPRISAWIDRSSGGIVTQLTQRHAVQAVIIVSLTPIAFSVLCYVAGLYRLRRTTLLLMLALRVPKLALYFYLVKSGWNAWS